MTSIFIERFDEKGVFLFAADTVFSAESTGIYFSGGAPPHDEWNYQSYLERRKLSVGKQVGNLIITESRSVKFRNLNKEGGIEDGENGICAYTFNNENK